MSTPEYNVWILNTSGTRVALVDDYKRLSYSLRTSRPGRFELELHRDSVHQQYLLKNYQIEIVRNGVSVQGGRIGRRAPNYGPDGKASEYMVASGASWLSMLGWRVIIPPAGSTHMADNDSIDDVMKYFVRQNCLTGTVVDPDRAITGLTVQADAGAHPTTANLRGRYQNLLDQLIAWSDTYGVDFDLVRTATGWDFRTYYPRLGTDRTEGNGAVVPVIFSINRGNVSEFEWWEDALEVQNFLYVGGQGEGTEREIVTRQDTNSIADWDRRENFVDARDLQYTSDLNLRGDEKLAAHGTEARGLKFTAIPVDNAVWGTDWFLGDKVTVYDPEWSITESAKIVEIDVEVTREDGETVVPIIGDLMPTLLDRIGEGQVDDGNQAGGDTPADPTAPDAPTGLSYSSAVQQDSKTGDFTAVLELAWSANTETDLDYYQVEVKLSTATNWDSAVTRATNFDWLGLIPGGSYVARVYAVDRAGNRSTAADFNGGGAITVTSDTTAPAAPANVIATGAFSKVIIEWDENSELDLAGYEVYVSDSSGFTPGAANLAYRGRSTAIAYTGVVSNTYYVRVRAYDRSGNASPYCNQASASTAQIGTTDISDLAVTNAKIGSLAVDAAKIANATITGGKIANEQVDTQHLVTNLIHTKKITIGTDGQASVVIDGATATKALYGYSWTGAAQQLEVAIYASGTNAGKIVAGAGNIVLDATALTFVPTAGSNTYLRFKAAGAAHEIGNIYADTSSDLIGLAKANATSGSLETMVYLRASTIELVNNAALGGSIAQVLLDASGHTQLWGYLYPGASGKQTTRYLYDAGATSGLAVAGGYFSTTSRLYIGTGSAVQTYHYFVADSDGFLNYTGRFLVGSSWPAGSVGLAVDPRTWAATSVVVNQFAIGAKSIAITEGVVGQTGNLYTAAIGVIIYSQSVKITTVPVAASLYIAGPPASSGTLSITAGYAIYVATGNVCLGGTHYISGGASGIGIDCAAGAAFDLYGVNHFFRMNSSSTNSYHGLIFAETGTAKGYIQIAGSGVATTTRRGYLELFGTSGISFWPDGANQLVTIAGSGNVTIGGTTPYKFNVKAAANQNFGVTSDTILTLYAYNDANDAFVAMGYRALSHQFTGNVGIGMIPTRPLDATGSIADWGYSLENTNDTGSGLAVSIASDDAARFLLGLVSNGGYKVKVMGDGKVGIGCSPSTNLHVYNTNDAAITVESSNHTSYWAGYTYKSAGTTYWYTYLPANDTPLMFQYVDTVRYKFQSDGTALADLGWSTFSPKPPKSVEKMNRDDWLDWALEHALKPVKQYSGIPDDPAEVQKYIKDPARIAIGTARYVGYLREWSVATDSRVAQLEARVAELEVEILKLRLN